MKVQPLAGPSHRGVRLTGINIPAACVHSGRGHCCRPPLPRDPELACENIPLVNLCVTLGSAWLLATERTPLGPLSIEDPPTHLYVPPHPSQPLKANRWGCGVGGRRPFKAANSSALPLVPITPVQS